MSLLLQYDAMLTTKIINNALISCFISYFYMIFLVSVNMHTVACFIVEKDNLVPQSAFMMSSAFTFTCGGSPQLDRMRARFASGYQLQTKPLLSIMMQGLSFCPSARAAGKSIYKSIYIAIKTCTFTAEFTPVFSSFLRFPEPSALISLYAVYENNPLSIRAL